jgi:hypothetical protein
MPPRKTRHPRSLDALFPRPKPPPVKRCPAGHRMGVDWRPVMGCSTCRKEAARADQAKALPPLPPAWPGGKVPAVLTMRVVDSGRLIVHAIPPHLIMQKRAQDRARGRRRRRRI